MSRGLVECDFPAYIGGNFKNLIPTRPSSLSRLAPPSSLSLSLSVLRAERETRGTSTSYMLTVEQTILQRELRTGVISFAISVFCSLLFLPDDTKEFALLPFTPLDSHCFRTGNYPIASEFISGDKCARDGLARVTFAYQLVELLFKRPKAKVILEAASDFTPEE